MRALAFVLPLVAELVVSPALARGVRLAAQAVERTDTPKRGMIRVTFDPRIMGWDQLFVAGEHQPLGAPLSGDSVGSASIPVVARLEQDVRTASGVPGFVASLGKGLLSARAERRVLPMTAEVGLTDRLSLGVMVPVVRVQTRAHFRLDTLGATVGANPLALASPGADAQYAGFFTAFDTTLARLDANIAGGAYGCPAGPQCGQARALAAQAHGVRDALNRAVYGAGSDSVAPFLPRAGSAGGVGIDSNVARIQRELASTYGVSWFTRSFLLPTAPLDTTTFESLLADGTRGFGTRPFRDTPRRLRWWLGDIELAAKYRMAAGPHYAAALALVVRLPTGHVNSANDLLSIPAGDHQTDLEARFLQELIVGHRLWLNFAVRAAQQRPGIRERRVAPPAALLVPRQAFARLRWDPGDYVAADFAPMYRFTPQFAVGPTFGYWSRGHDRYTFLTPQDSINLASRLGAPTPASVLDAQTSVRWLRVGGAATYVRPGFEAGFSVEQTVSGAGGAGRTPVATVFRIVMRTSRKLF